MYLMFLILDDMSRADGLNNSNKEKIKNLILGETCCQLQSGDYGCCPLRESFFIYVKMNKT
jgi:hypothetical protein